MTELLSRNKLAARVNFINISLMVVVFVVISVVAMLTMTAIARTASMRLAYIHSLESVANFNVQASVDLALLRQVARTAAVQEWFANEDDPEKKLAAYNTLMYFASSLQSNELYLGILGSLNEYSLDLNTTIETFEPYDSMTRDNPMDAWFFDLLDSDNYFLFNIDVDKIAHRWRIWINYVVAHDGQSVGVLSTSLRIDDVLNSMFGHYTEGNITGYVLDNAGFIHIGSVTLMHYAELEHELVHISSVNATLGNFVMDFLGRSDRFFSEDSRPEIVPLRGGAYSYAAVAPIANSDWLVVTLFNHDALFSAANLLPFVAALLFALILYMIISSAVTRHCVLKPLTHLTESVSKISDISAESVDVYGDGRVDEIGNLSQNIQNMWHSLRAKNLDLHSVTSKQRNVEKLLHAINSAAAMLLDVRDDNSFDLALLRSMELIRQPLKADRVQLWRASLDTEGFNTNLVSQWLSELGQKNPQIAVPQKIPYGTLPKWEELFLRRECFNGPVAHLPPEERRFLEAYGELKSAVIIPIFLQDHFWGFFAISDYVTERVLSNEEMDILHSASLMIACTYQRVEMAATERQAQEALKQREKLLHTVNKAAEILLTASEEDTMNALTTGMEIVGHCLGVDRAQIWRNEKIDGELHFIMCYEWLSDLGKQKPEIPIGREIPYSGRPGWLQMFMNGEYINGPVSKLPPEDAAFLGRYEMVSIVILPLFLDKELFGFFSVIDYRREYTFTNDEMDMVASAGLMFTNVFNRNAQRDLAFTDALTGIRNRRYLMEAAEQESKRCIEKNLDFSLIMIDIDHFKAINDQHGHPCGDEVLKILTSRIRHVLKQDTLLARYGGEEFVVTLSGVDHENALKTAWRLQKAIAVSAFQVGNLEITVTASFGVASKTGDCTKLLEIINNADKALYQAKETGRNTVVGYI